MSPTMELPATSGQLIRRRRDVASLRAILGRSGARDMSDPMIVTIHGLPGTGTSTLAAQCAREHCSRYPDGLLYVDLKGASGAPLKPLSALYELMRGLGNRGIDLPPELDGMVSEYQDQLGGRRAIVVLDNARNESQVRPLLPAGPGCLVLVTSRHPLAGLRSSASYRLGVMNEKESVELLAAVAGDGARGRRNAVEARRVASLCGYLPLAVSIAGAVLRHCPGMTVTDLRARLDEQRLGAVSWDNPDLRASFEVSYENLDPGQQTLLRRLQLLPEPTFGTGPATALMHGDGTTAGMLDGLVRRQLLRPVPPARFTFHDLIGQFASEKLQQHEAAPDRQAAHERALRFYLGEAASRTALLDPSVGELQNGGAPAATLDEQVEALEWLEGERATLVTASRQAAQIQAHDVTWRLAVSLVPLFEVRGHWFDWHEAQDAALTAARASGDLFALAWAHLSAGHFHGLGERSGQFADCHLEEALEMATAVGRPRLQARALYLMGRVEHDRGRRKIALARYQRAAAIFADEDMRQEQASTILSIAAVLQERRAITTDELIAMGDAVLDSLSEAPPEFWTLRTIGRISEHLGRVEANRGELERADRYANRSREAFSRIGFRHGQGRALRDLGRILLEQHRWTGESDLLERSTALFDESTALFRTTGDRRSEGEALKLAGTALARSGDRVGADLRLQDARAANTAIVTQPIDQL